MEINKRKHEMEKTVDRHYYELALEKIADGDNREKEKENEEKEKKQYVKQKLIKKIQEEKIEGEIIKRKDIQSHKDQM